MLGEWPPLGSGPSVSLARMRLMGRGRENMNHERVYKGRGDWQQNVLYMCDYMRVCFPGQEPGSIFFFPLLILSYIL